MSNLTSPPVVRKRIGACAAQTCALGVQKVVEIRPTGRNKRSENDLQLHQNRALTAFASVLLFRPSTVERVGVNHRSPVQSRLGDPQGRATCWAAGPEKTDGFCEEPLGSGTAKAAIASGAVTVHASTLLTPSQEPAARP